MKLQKILLICSMLVAAQLLTGCESEDERKLASAQSCLDRATDTTTANACSDIVQGLESESAYLIRCSANFIAQGFTASRMASAFQQIKDNTNGSDPMVSLMGWFVFQNVAGSNSVTTTVSNCTKSNVRSMLRLATAAQLATTFASYTGLGNFTTTDTATLQANMTAAIAAANGDPVKTAEIGAVAITAAAAYCNEGSSYNSTEICTNLNAALAVSTDPATIGQQLVTELNR
jgi:hypothetical protein